ncbi:MAG: BON domain-containing protein [Proteobacteria bacterium]|nr:BON domain-containing protein [Pseudomonadota bacterium]
MILKTLKSRTSAVFIAIVMATVLGCQANLPKESAGEYVDDAVITTKVKASIVDQPMLKAMEIHVETLKGTVRLSGYVASQAQIDKAGAVARGVPGVRSVKNDLQLKR